jgi:pimeloyl-ACP methyl ester carboxylesterase
MAEAHRRGASVLARVALFGISAVAAVWILLGRPASVAEPARRGPATTFAASLARVDSVRAHEGPEVNSECRTRLLTSGKKADRVVVLLHGFTNCPKQFDRLGTDLARLGCNVLIPRLPQHGMSNRMTDDLSRLTAPELVQAGDDAVDIAEGLGSRVTVVGLSSSGVLAAWLAQRRADIECAVVIAPSFAPRDVPAPAARRLANALLALPNFFVWWDPKLREALPGPAQCYPRFASRGLAEVYRLGFSVLDDAGRAGPRARSVILVTTATDEAVNNDVARELARRWRSHGAQVRTFEFPASQHVHHDMIDPEQPYQRVEVTYPVIEGLVSTGRPFGGPGGHR